MAEQPKQQDSKQPIKSERFPHRILRGVHVEKVNGVNTTFEPHANALIDSATNLSKRFGEDKFKPISRRDYEEQLVEQEARQEELASV